MEKDLYLDLLDLKSQIHYILHWKFEWDIIFGLKLDPDSVPTKN